MNQNESSGFSPSDPAFHIRMAHINPRAFIVQNVLLSIWCECQAKAKAKTKQKQKSTNSADPKEKVILVFVLETLAASECLRLDLGDGKVEWHRERNLVVIVWRQPYLFFFFSE